MVSSAKLSTKCSLLSSVALSSARSVRGFEGFHVRNSRQMLKTARAFPNGGRALLIAQSFRLEWFTVAWMTIESAVAIGTGIIAHSVSLTAFGIDSLIELAS